MIVVDTSAVIAVLLGEPEATALADVLASGEKVALSTGTALEMALVAQAKWGFPGAARLDSFLGELPLIYVPVDTGHLRLAREAHGRYGRGTGHPARLNFGDCFSYALARALEAPLLFKGDDFIHTDVRSALSNPP